MNFILIGWFTGKNCNKSLSHKRVKDFWFISNSYKLDLFSELYFNINDYIKSGCPIMQNLGISSHYLIKHHLDLLNIKPIELLKSCKNNESKSDIPLIRYHYFNEL